MYRCFVVKKLSDGMSGMAASTPTRTASQATPTAPESTASAGIVSLELAGHTKIIEEYEFEEPIEEDYFIGVPPFKVGTPSFVVSERCLQKFWIAASTSNSFDEFKANWIASYEADGYIFRPSESPI